MIGALTDAEIDGSTFSSDRAVTSGRNLFCASAGLAAWFHHCDREALAAKLSLRKNHRVLFAQTVGYPRR
jgi:hypothetical protein